MANMSHTATTTITTLKMAPTDSMREDTISFMATLCEITRKGLSVLSSLKILIIGKSTPESNMSIIEVTTMNRSS